MIDLDPDVEALVERVLARMQRAGWIGTVVRTKEVVIPQITHLGYERMHQLLGTMIEINSAGKPMTDEEFQMLLALIASFPRQQREDISGPPPEL